jgi:hypothetical protein
MSNEIVRPRIGIGAMVQHPAFGLGKIVDYEADAYVVLFKNADVRRVAYTFDAMRAEEPVGDPDLDRIRQAMREVLNDYGWLDSELELGKRWVGGSLKLIPGKTETQSKDIPIEVFVKKIVSIRDRLRVLEQKLNSHPVLSGEEKLELQGYVTRCYGSLTSFNALFTAKESQFHGTGKEE